MPAVVVGGVTIPVAVSSPSFSRSDAVDRGRTFDNTLFASQTGGAARAWSFSTPPVAPGLYEPTLSIVAAQLCSGDILTLPTMCQVEFLGGKPVRAQGTKVTLDFVLHEVQPAKVLLKYAPGDTITGESFTRSTTATYYTAAGLVASAAINTKRDSHYPTVGGTRSLLLEGSRENGLTKSEEFDHADWTKQASTVSANATTAPDGTTTADKIVETAVTQTHGVYRTTPALAANNGQTTSIFAKAGERTWLCVQTFDKAATVRQSWVNLSTGVTGTVNAGHTITFDTLASGWFRVIVAWNAGSGATAPEIGFFGTTGDGVISFLGDITKGFYLWGADHATNQGPVSSYIPTTTAAVTRGADSSSVPFTTPPREMSVYAKFVERGSAQVPPSRLFAITSAADAFPQFICYAPSGEYVTFHHNNVSLAQSAIAAAPAFGDTVEIVSRLFGDGSVDVTQSLNSGTATSGAQSGALALAASWSGLLLWLNSGGTSNIGYIALQSFKIVAGSRSLAEMRVL